MNILYQDAHILIINKPSGLLSQPGRTIEDSAHYRLKQQFPNIELIHRLDQHTSGLMVFALTQTARKSLAKQFQFREVRKVYQALVFGLLPDQGHVQWPMRCDWPNRPRQEIHQDGKAASTYWKVIETLSVSGQACSRVELTPITGRSHQLRVHMAHMSTPILGDSLYAHEEALQAFPRLCLHAHVLRFQHPITGQPIQFVSNPDF